jgi:tetratricopeptide (TPR) repeat protein
MAKKLIPLLLFPLFLGWHWFEPVARKNQKGIEAYRQGKYASALEQFLSAKGLKSGDPQLVNNTAATLYQLKKYQEALDEFSHVDPARLGESAADFHYNLGNAYFRLGPALPAAEPGRCAGQEKLRADPEKDPGAAATESGTEPATGPAGRSGAAKAEIQRHDAVS